MQIMNRAEPVESHCNDHVFCGMPVYRPRHIQQVNHSHWIPAGAPNALPEPTIQRIINGQPENRLMFEVNGPSYRVLHITPMPGVEIVRWSFHDSVADTQVDFQGRKTYFITYAAGTTAPATFWVDFTTSNPSTSKKLDIGLAAHYTLGTEERTTEFQRLIDSYPFWCHVSSWISIYNSYQF